MPQATAAKKPQWMPKPKAKRPSTAVAVLRIFGQLAWTLSKLALLVIVGLTLIVLTLVAELTRGSAA